jgi:CRP/FNR family transcriptional regulator, anaerobic regulatory protein
MFDLFKAYMLSKAPFTTAEIAAVERVVTECPVPAGSVIFTEGTHWPYNGFVCKGLVQKHTLHDNGFEKTVGFCCENYWLGDRSSLLTGNAMPYSALALEDTYLLLIENTDFENLRITVPSFNEMMSELITNNISVTQKEIADSMVMGDEQRYADMIQKYPALMHRVPPHMIASYLNIGLNSLNAILNGSSKTKSRE